MRVSFHCHWPVRGAVRRQWARDDGSGFSDDNINADIAGFHLRHCLDVVFGTFDRSACPPCWVGEGGGMVGEVAGGLVLVFRC